MATPPIRTPLTCVHILDLKYACTYATCEKQTKRIVHLAEYGVAVVHWDHESLCLYIIVYCSVTPDIMSDTLH